MLGLEVDWVLKAWALVPDALIWLGLVWWLEVGFGEVRGPPSQPGPLEDGTPRAGPHWYHQHHSPPTTLTLYFL